jgi:N-acetyl sugar amidotransferase
MDTSDPDIVFDDDGVCNHCHQFERLAQRSWHPDAYGERLLDDIVAKMRHDGDGKEYDCILGLSGGIDSSYLALKMAERDLRILAVHVDAGWNSEIAVHNIEQIVEQCGIELFTHVVNWEEMRSLQLAYLRSGIANQDVPQDHIFFSTLYHHAVKHKIRYVLNGGNIATEGVFPSAWHGSALDSRNLKAIHDRFGNGEKLATYRTVSFLQYYVEYPYIRRMKVVRPLNYMPYDKTAALAELESAIGYRPYGRKHGESLFTRFFQNHYLPTRFGYDKRRPHLSSLILSGQLTRAAAIEALAEELYSPSELNHDIDFVSKKLRLTREEFLALLEVPVHRFEDFPNNERKYRMLKSVQGAAERLTRRKLSVYG